MVLRRAHLICLACLGAAPAAACGFVPEKAQIREIAPGGELVLADGERARLGGVSLAAGAEAALARLVGVEVGVALLSPALDRWGRRMVDLIAPDGESVTLDLVVQGLARVRPEVETRGCNSERLDAEAAARSAGEGLWAHAGAILAAEDAEALVKGDGRFVLVEGAVRRVGATAAKIYLDFEGRGRFSVVVARKIESQFQRAGVDLRTLAGRRVRVRGVMDVRFGPRIEISDPSTIEPLESVRETSRGG